MPMLNQCVLVGRFKTIDDYDMIIVSLPEDKGEDTKVLCKVSKKLMDQIKEHLIEDDLIGIKGKLIEHSLASILPSILVEKITFLSKRKEQDE